MISDRLIEEGSLVVDGGRTSVEVRIPWYRAVPASCIADVSFSVDGQAPPATSVRVELNGTARTIEEFPSLTDEQWFPTDSLTVSGDLDVEPGTEHQVAVELKLFIPYIVTAHGVLMIDERKELRMTAHAAREKEAVR
ncbi:C-glycoside deglycosidase beta subunit domain-containing protein [Nocardioides sp. AN3]